MSNKITAKKINELVDKVEYFYSKHSNTIICILTLRNGFGVVGESGCIDMDNAYPKTLWEYIKFKYTKDNRSIGKEIAYEDAISKVWLLEGYKYSSK